MTDDTRHDRSEPAPLATGRLGMRLLLAALAVLFAASVTGLLVVRSNAAVWPPPGVPELPRGLWLSTLLILAASAAIHWGLTGIRRGDAQRLRRGLALTALLGLGFLASQTVSWFALVAVNLTAKTNLYGFTFYLLTGLHALHVVGGLVPLGLVTARAWRGRYSAASYEGVEYTATYWHFLDVIWLILWVVLLLTS